jgi:hypothetical protein
MNAAQRIGTFGLVSGLIWSVAPGVLMDGFSTRADVITTLMASVVAGVASSAILAPFVARLGRAVVVVLGLLSLPLGAFAFGFSLTLIYQLLPGLTNGTRPSDHPLSQGLFFAFLSTVSVFAVGLFPLAVLTTFLLRSFVRSQQVQRA